MFGAIDRSHLDATGQAKPITAHWLDADGCVAWLCIRGALSGVVADTRIVVRGGAELSLQCSASGSEAFGSGSWLIGARRIEVAGIEVAPTQARADQLRGVLKLPSGEAVLRFA